MKKKMTNTTVQPPPANLSAQIIEALNDCEVEVPQAVWDRISELETRLEALEASGKARSKGAKLHIAKKAKPDLEEEETE